MTKPRVRIYELSKALGLNNKELMDLLEKKFNIIVKGHTSVIEQEIADKITAELSKSAGKNVAKSKSDSDEKSEDGVKKDKAEKTKVDTSTTQKAISAKKSKDSSSVSTDSTPVIKTVKTPSSPQPVKTSKILDVPLRQASQTAVAYDEKTSKKPDSKGMKTPNAISAGPKDDVKSVSASLKTKSDVAKQSDAKKQSSAAIAVKETKVKQEEEDSLPDILKPVADDEPYSDIAKTVERYQKTEHVKTSFKKEIPEADKNEKAVPLTAKKEENFQASTSTLITAEPVLPEEAVVVDIEAPLSIAELAHKLKKRETELIRHLFMKGIMVTVNQTMPIEDAVQLAKELGFEAKGPDKKVATDQFSAPELKVRHAKGNHLRHRAPVVSIMGHVDHGKTSLLDAIRESRHRIVDTEAGGITQSIGAYTVLKDDHRIVFIDTPGHEAFTAMRMRGAQATDIAILVVAADDGVMPQTIEAINHAKAANIPIIVAINKIDRPNADPERVMVQLSEYGLNAEKWGGDTIMVEVSALQKLGLDDLLEMIILLAELQDLKADPTIPAEGVVIEARMDKGKGAVATVLIQNGTLHIGENVLMNRVGGRVRALINDFGERIKSAGPSTPVEILGFKEVPQAGDSFIVIRNDKEFKRLLQQHQNIEKEQRLSKVSIPGLITERETARKDFYLIVKADTQGSIEAITNSILQLATEEVSINIVHAGIGDISEADVLLASASNALIIAFNVKEEANAQRAAQDQGIQIRSYDVIYHVTEDLEKLMLGMLKPETEEQETGSAEVRQIFTFGKTFIAGCYVTEGKIVRNALSRVFRNGKEIYKGSLNNLKRFKEDAKEVTAGYECGISFDKFNDIQQGDTIKAYTLKEIERTSL